MPPYCRGSKHQKNGLAPLEERKRLCDPPNLPNLISFICLFPINMQPLTLFLRKEPGGLSSSSAGHALPRRFRSQRFFCRTGGRRRVRSTIRFGFQAQGSFSSNCSRYWITSRVIGVGVEPPPVTPTFFSPFIHSGSISVTSATRYASTPAISFDTWASRLELLLRGSPTTITRSVPRACLATASCRSWVAKQISL